jgi:hypothetical protein
VKRSPSKGVPEREFMMVYSILGQFGSDFSQEIFVINYLLPVDMSYLKGKIGLLMI